MEAQFYKGKGNDVVMSLFNDNVLIIPSSLTKLQFIYQGGSIDSLDSPALFSFEAEGVRLKFGASDIPPGTYSMKLVVYTNAHPEGVVWADSVIIKVREL